MKKLKSIKDQILGKIGTEIRDKFEAQIKSESNKLSEKEEILRAMIFKHPYHRRTINEEGMPDFIECYVLTYYEGLSDMYDCLINK